MVRLEVRAVLLLLGIMGTGVSAQSPAPYVDPVLRVLGQAELRAGIERNPRLGRDEPAQSQPFGGRVALSRATVTAPAQVSVFVQLRDARGLDELRALGATIGTVRNNIVTAELPLTALERLDSTTAIRMVEAAQTVTVNHDSALKAIRANDVRRQVGGVWTGVTGAGAIVGVYDTGIDFRHEDFLDVNGRTRLLGLWDQTRSGTPPPGFNLGNYCSREAIQRVIDNPTDTTPCDEQDTHGHGTHTAGTAAGDGSASTPVGSSTYQYAGVAPLADLLIVKGGNGSFSESNILDGLRWLEAQGRALNRPVVVNLSLGGQTGAHDGTRLYEQEIDNLSRPGFVVVISSGNEGSHGNLQNRDGSPFVFTPFYIHGTGLATTGSTREFSIQFPSTASIPGGCNELIQLSFWYEAQDRLRITVVRPDGSSHSNDPGASNLQDNVSGSIQINNAANGPNPQNGDHEALIVIGDCGSSQARAAAGTWILRVTTMGTGSGQAFHFWMNVNTLGARGVTGFDNRYIVGSPGNARSAVTVGAYASRMCWPSGTVQFCFPQNEEIGDLARFSNGGPTRDGRLKPELVAPGIAVISARSRHAAVAANRVAPDLVHWANQGTSMAAPQVTGTIALMMQIRPNLTFTEAKQAFERGALRDAFTNRTYGNDFGAQPRDWWGYGKLLVPRALCQLGTASSLTLVSISPEADTLPRNATLQLDACAVGVSSSVTFESTDPSVAQVDAFGMVRALQNGNTLIIARAGTNADTARLTVVPPATVAASGSAAVQSSVTLGRARTQLTLLALNLRVHGFENVNIESLSFGVHGVDPGARLLVAQDLNANGRLDASDRVIASAPRGPGAADTVRIATTAFTVARRDSARLLIGIELSGAAANNTQFQMRFVSGETRTVGARSGARDQLEPVSVAITSAVTTTTVLANAEVFSLSENPVRGTRVVFNFAERPRVAGIYTLNGRRVLDLTRRLDLLGSVTWDLRNDEGTRVAPGIYLVIFDVRGRLIREKLFVLGGQ
ncbi:MAG: S8 family serine peptidase [Longimicrobiales bacterium]